MIIDTTTYRMGKILLGQISFYSSADEKGKKKLFPTGGSLSNYIESTDTKNISLNSERQLLLHTFCAIIFI